MSRADLERFTADLERIPGLMEEFTSLGASPDAWRERAKTKGYHLSSEEATGLSSSHRELSLEDLESVAGGWPDGGGG